MLWNRSAVSTSPPCLKSRGQQLHPLQPATIDQNSLSGLEVPVGAGEWGLYEACLGHPQTGCAQPDTLDGAAGGWGMVARGGTGNQGQGQGWDCGEWQHGAGAWNRVVIHSLYGTILPWSQPQSYLPILIPDPALCPPMALSHAPKWAHPAHRSLRPVFMEITEPGPLAVGNVEAATGRAARKQVWPPCHT